MSALGLTECQIVAMCDMDDPNEKLATTKGRPAPVREVKVVNPDEHVCGPNEEGELRLIAPQMFLGYVDAGLDAEAFDSPGYFRTGDLGFFDEEGYVHVVGRLKDVITRKGENVGAGDCGRALPSSGTSGKWR